jgi:hypothetical protein
MTTANEILMGLVSAHGLSQLDSGSHALPEVLFVNCTPHPLTVEGLGTLAPSGILPRVGTVRAPATTIGGVRLVRTSKGAVEGLPDGIAGVYLVVSGMVLDALNGTRADVVAPDTGADAIRNEKGHIVAVRGFV